jgi:hypothetical protein
MTDVQHISRGGIGVFECGHRWDDLQHRRCEHQLIRGPLVASVAAQRVAHRTFHRPPGQRSRAVAQYGRVGRRDRYSGNGRGDERRRIDVGEEHIRLGLLNGPDLGSGKLRKVTATRQACNRQHQPDAAAGTSVPSRNREVLRPVLDPA